MEKNTYKNNRTMDRKELDKYKMIKTERAKNCAYRLYEIWKSKTDFVKMEQDDFEQDNSDVLFAELKKVRIVSVQMIAEETGRKYDPDIFIITRRGYKQTLYIMVDYSAPYEPFNKDNPVTEETLITDIKPYVTTGLYNCLRKQFETIGEALKKTDKELSQYRNFGKTRRIELNEFYQTFNLR